MVETIINDNLQFYCSFSSGMKEMIVIWKKSPYTTCSQRAMWSQNVNKPYKEVVKILQIKKKIF